MQCSELQFVDVGGVTRFTGTIRTVRCLDDTVLVKRVIAERGDGQVLVIDGGASARTALMGDRTAAIAAEHGWAGMVINGLVRDVVALRSVPIGIKALGTNPRRPAQTGAGETDVPVMFGRVSFVPGRRVWCDDDGVIVERP